MLKLTTKRIVKAIFLLLALPFVFLVLLLNVFGSSDSGFTSISQLLSLVPGKPGVYLRAGFYKISCPNTSDNISIGFLTIFSHMDTTVELGVYIGPQCNIGKCHIRANTLVGSGVHILSGNKQHSFDDPTMPIQAQGGAYSKISIGSDCWLGNGSIILASIADRTIVAAGAVVTKPIIETMGIYAGNPARRIKERSPNTESAVQERNLG